MSISEDIDKALFQCRDKEYDVHGIIMSPEAFVQLRNELFLNTGTVIINSYQEVIVTVQTAMIGIKDWFIDTADEVK